LGEGSPCQDSHGVRQLGEAADGVILACVADGAGSAQFGDVGSTIACGTFIESAASYYALNGRFDGLCAADVLAWCEDARERIQKEATNRDCPTRELATTLCAAIVTPSCSCFFQIGDGAIILGSAGAYGVVFWPQSGEYANSTNFLTSDEYRKRLEFVTTTTSRFSDMALLTDGLERLALRFDNHTPFVPFFDPLFRALRNAEDVVGLNDGLRRFLQSDPVQSRSDDDKTLILATRNSHDLGDAA
jgi:hypothetical protein